MVLNLIINTIAPAIIFRNDAFIFLKGNSPTLMNLLLPTVAISVFATTMATFITMTKQRTSQRLEPVLAPDTRWVGVALVTALVLAVVFAGLCLLILIGLQSVLPNFQLAKDVALILSGVVGALVACVTSLIAVKRAILV